MRLATLCLLVFSCPGGCRVPVGSESEAPTLEPLEVNAGFRYALSSVRFAGSPISACSFHHVVSCCTDRYLDSV